MKSHYKLPSNKKKELIIWLSTTLLLILVIVFFLIFLHLKKSKEFNLLVQNRCSLQNCVQVLEKDLTAKRNLSKNKDYLKKVFNRLNRYSTCENKEFMGKLLVDLAGNIAPTIYLSRLNCTNKIEITGYAVDVQSVLNLLQTLSKLPYINHGKIVHLKTTSSDSLLEFLIKLDLKADREYVQN